jgi:3-dehydroquinate dehydratase-1
MIRSIGSMSLGGVPRVALAVGDHEAGHAAMLAQGVSLVEARIDWFSSHATSDVLSQLELFKKLGKPILATIRPGFEGGSWTGSEESRLALFLACLPLVDAVDIELAASRIQAELARACRAAGKPLLVSSHDFQGTPPEAQLAAKVTQARALGADIVKLACMARVPEDVTRMLECVKKNRDLGMVGISMGPLGALSRVAGPMFGSLLTYTSREEVHGQLPLDALLRCLRAFYPDFQKEWPGPSQGEP